MQEPKHGGNHCRCFLPTQAGSHPCHPILGVGLCVFPPSQHHQQHGGTARIPYLTYSSSQCKADESPLSQPLLIITNASARQKAAAESPPKCPDARCGAVASRVWLGEPSVMFRLLRFATPSSLIAFQTSAGAAPLRLDPCPLAPVFRLGLVSPTSCFRNFACVYYLLGVTTAATLSPSAHKSG